MKLKNFAMITEDKVTEIFCIADDFCKVFDAQMVKYTFKVAKTEHRSFGNFVVNLLGGIAAYCYFPKNHPYEYRPLICQMTDSLLYSKVYFVELTLCINGNGLWVVGFRLLVVIPGFKFWVLVFCLIMLF